MTSTTRLTYCSSVTQDADASPIGSAWFLRRIMLVEMPVPWAYNSLRSHHAPEGLEELVIEVFNELQPAWGFIGFAPDNDYSIPGMTRIFDLTQGDTLATIYQRTSYVVPTSETVAYLRRISFEPEHPSLDAVRQPHDQQTRDFFVCTHGSVDRCCATKGYPIYQLMRHMADGAPHPTRVWRCTHFGGHAFAPTALEAPTGRYWGRLEVSMLGQLMRKSGTPAELTSRYRGWSALEHPLWQVAERALFAEFGWDWEAAAITGISGEATVDSGGTLSVTFTHPSLGFRIATIDIRQVGSAKVLASCVDEGPYDAPQFTSDIVAVR